MGSMMDMMEIESKAPTFKTFQEAIEWICHELNQPILGIRGFSEMLISDVIHFQKKGASPNELNTFLTTVQADLQTLLDQAHRLNHCVKTIKKISLD